MNRISTFLIIIASLIIFPAKSADDDYELALKSFQQKDINSAEIHLKNALKNNPKNLFHARPIVIKNRRLLNYGSPISAPALSIP